MDLNLSLLRLASGLSAHSTQRQSVIARNVANADTPGYKARDLQPFSEIMDASGQPAAPMRATRPGHLGAGETWKTPEVTAMSPFGTDQPNGNTVALEDQVIRATESQQSFNLALGVYKKTLDILRMSLSSGR